jgi:signal transduction histidine kinase
MPTSTQRECCVPVVERARSFLRLVCDAPGTGRSRQRASDAAHAERLATLGRLNASIMHEVNGPLTYLLMSLESLAAATARDEETRTMVRAAFEGAQLIRQLASDVTLFARDERASADVDLAGIVRAAGRIVGTRVRSVAELHQEIGAVPLVRGDPTRLLQVVVNVLLNAADACEASGLRGRHVRASLATNVRGDATLAICDDAAGVEPAVAQRVFEPFFTTKGPGKGTGRCARSLRGRRPRWLRSLVVKHYERWPKPSARGFRYVSRWSRGRERTRNYRAATAKLRATLLVFLETIGGRE